MKEFIKAQDEFSSGNSHITLKDMEEKQEVLRKSLEQDTFESLVHKYQQERSSRRSSQNSYKEKGIKKIESSSSLAEKALEFSKRNSSKRILRDKSSLKIDITDLQNPLNNNNLEIIMESPDLSVQKSVVSKDDNFSLLYSQISGEKKSLFVEK